MGAAASRQPSAASGSAPLKPWLLGAARVGARLARPSRLSPCRGPSRPSGQPSVPEPPAAHLWAVDRRGAQMAASPIFVRVLSHAALNSFCMHRDVEHIGSLHNQQCCVVSFRFVRASWRRHSAVVVKHHHNASARSFGLRRGGTLVARTVAERGEHALHVRGQAGHKQHSAIKFESRFASFAAEWADNRGLHFFDLRAMASDRKLSGRVSRSYVARRYLFFARARALQWSAHDDPTTWIGKHAPSRAASEAVRRRVVMRKGLPRARTRGGRGAGVG